MSHVNVSVPDKYISIIEQKDLKICLLEAELKFIKERYQWMRNEFTNIPEAIDEFGYVDLYNKSDGIEMTVINKDKYYELHEAYTELKQKSSCSSTQGKK